MSEPLRVVVLGSTGSIGTQTLDVVRWRGWKVVGLAAGRNRALLAEQVRAFRPEVVYAAGGVPELPPGVRAAASAAEVAAWDADVVVAAIPGLAGLEPVRAAVRAGRRVALANKESMVAAGPLLQEEARKYGAAFVPVDSEHSALFQALAGERPEDVAELVLTASGGPFREGPEDLSGVTPEEALRHPRWSMGPKVTIDSATLMNKGLEVLEAHALFGTELERIKVVVHPQSYVHSLVRFVDGQIKAVLGPTDMRLAIQYALTYPERAPTPGPRSRCRRGSTSNPRTCSASPPSNWPTAPALRGGWPPPCSTPPTRSRSRPFSRAGSASPASPGSSSPF